MYRFKVWLRNTLLPYAKEYPYEYPIVWSSYFLFGPFVVGFRENNSDHIVTDWH
jgi:hypothetical protein